jgi:hypothetical protein
MLERQSISQMETTQLSRCTLHRRSIEEHLVMLLNHGRCFSNQVRDSCWSLMPVILLCPFHRVRVTLRHVAQIMKQSQPRMRTLEQPNHKRQWTDAHRLRVQTDHGERWDWRGLAESESKIRKANASIVTIIVTPAGPFTSE